MSATADLARRFAAPYTGALTDVLDRRGHTQRDEHQSARLDGQDR